MDSVVAAGGAPLLLPAQDPVDAALLLRHVDGLLLPGGSDIDPHHYGQDVTGTVATDIDPVRDCWELALLRYAVVNRVPMLNICRGAQLLNVAAGGSLHQDVPAHTPDTGSSICAASHSTKLVACSRLAKIFNTTTILVNTLHHQSIARVAADWTVSAFAEDGRIESIETTDSSWFALGVQWHPEYLFEDSKPLFEAFIAATCR